MKLLVKQVTIADENAPYHQQQKDILIDNGIIAAIGDSLASNDATVVDAATHAAPGWVDVFARFGDPGYEYRETIETGARAAAAGGFTHVFVVPNTTPVVSGKSQVEYLVQKAARLAVDIRPLGAVTKNAEGKELAEMYDMLSSGAIAFSDGTQPVQSPGLLLKALQYVKAFDGVIVQLPVDKSIGKLGLMSEGITSTQLGLPGIPEIAEELIIYRDIELAKYTGSRLHITGVSTQRGVAMIQQAKNEGCQVTCSVTPYHLWFCDEDLTTYDTNLKVDPPLRSRDNMMGLRKAVEDGWVDCISAHHMPHNWDEKVCEFEYAKHGMAGLESLFSVVNTLFPNMHIAQKQALLGSNARRIFGLPAHTIAQGNPADITLFNTTGSYTFSKTNIAGKSVHNAFIDQTLTGRPVGIINRGQLYLNK